ncbi:MAG: hypothetical protein HY553_18830, partial [Elusimicrobia bacterium]|nr:hypothetical protein [Elusimicrobiota bacterium]
MLPLVPAWRLAAFCALAQLVVSAGAPFDSRREPVGPAVRAQLEYIDYRFVAASGQVLGPDGKPITVGDYRTLVGRFDLRGTPISENERLELAGLGFHFDDETGIVHNLEGKPSTVLEVRALLRTLALHHRHQALERLHTLLSKQDPGRPLPPAALDQARKILENRPEVDGSIRRLVQSGASAGAAAKDVATAYADSQRFFDASAGLRAHLGAALDLPLGPRPPRPPVYYNDAEKQLGQTLGREMTELFSRYPTGREVLGRFRGLTGSTSLPEFSIVKLGPRAMGAYFPGTRSMAIGHDGAVRLILEPLDEPRRAELAPKLDTPQKLARYLLAHPQDRKRLLESIDDTIIHELTHAHQDRRTTVLSEAQAAGRVPAAVYLEFEREAFLTEMRYMHDKVVADPAKVVSKDWFHMYRRLLESYPDWKREVVGTHASLFPDAAADFPTAQEIQKKRLGIAAELAKRGWRDRVTQWARMLGLRRGTSELELEAL